LLLTNQENAMKRIRYISRFKQPMTSEEIAELAATSAANNAKQDITGLLIATGEVFFQIIEGPDDRIDAIFRRITDDDRHRNVLVLGTEQGDILRLCPDWAMKKVDVSSDTKEALYPIRQILESIFLQKESLDRLQDALELFTWREALSTALDS
jgi:hypothetical protein